MKPSDLSYDWEWPDLWTICILWFRNKWIEFRYKPLPGRDIDPLPYGLFDDWEEPWVSPCSYHPLHHYPRIRFMPGLILDKEK